MYYLSSFCCICLNSKELLQNINETDTDNIKLYKKLRSFYKKWDDFESNCPKFICCKCCSDLREAYSFKQKCYKNLKLFKGYMRQLTEKHANQENEYNNLNVDITDLRSEISLVYDSDNTFMLNHIEPESMSIETVYNTFPQVQVLNIIENEQELIELEIKQEPEDSPIEESNFITVEDYIVQEDLVLQVEEQNFIKFRPEDITVINYESDVLDVGKDIARFENKNLHQCRLCDKSFIQAPHLNRHIRSIHTHAEKHTCSECHKVFNRKSSLTRHMLLHGEKTQHCPFCSKSYYVKANLDKHILSHTGLGQKFICNICNKMLSTKWNLKIHMESHEEKNSSGEESVAENCSNEDENFQPTSQFKMEYDWAKLE